MSATLAHIAVLLGLVILGALAAGAVILWLDHLVRRKSPHQH
jgi:hypothetical protein